MRFIVCRVVSAAVMIALLLAASTNAAFSQTSLAVQRIDGSVASVALNELPRRSVEVREQVFKRVYSGVMLRDVLTKAGVPAGEALRGPAMRLYVTIVGQDGYKAVFALAELDAGFTDDLVLIADNEGGQPLLPDQGPLRVVASGDKRPARWVRQVVRVELREAP